MFDGNYVFNFESKTRTENHVTVAEVKHNLYLLTEETEDDEFIEGLINAAIDDAESYTGYNFGLNNYNFRAYNFSSNKLEIQETPFIAITELRHSDDCSTWNVIPAEDYMIDKKRGSFVIYFNENKEYPCLDITFSAGFAVDTLPANATRAIVLKASDMYDAERGTFSAKLQNNTTYTRLLNAYYITRW